MLLLVVLDDSKKLFVVWQVGHIVALLPPTIGRVQPVDRAATEKSS